MNTKTLEDKVLDKRSFLKGFLGMTLGTLIGSNSNRVEADDLNDALFAMGALLESGIVPTKDYNNADFLRRLGIAQQKIALYNSIYIRTIPEKLDIVPYEENPILKPAVSFYIYNEWKDLDGNNKAGIRSGLFRFRIKDELIGVNKKSFYSSESLWASLLTKNLEGHTTTLVFLDPQKKEVFSDCLRIDDYAWRKNWNVGKTDWKNKVLKNHGYGNYYAVFFIDDQLIGVRGFNWIPNHQAYIGNYWVDLNNDGVFDISEEVVGLGKRVFVRDERITLVLSSHESIGRNVEAKLFTPSGESINLYSTKIRYKYTVSHSEPLNASDLVDRYGKGSYKGVFYLDGSYGGGIDFEIK